MRACDKAITTTTETTTYAMLEHNCANSRKIHGKYKLHAWLAATPIDTILIQIQIQIERYTCELARDTATNSFIDEAT